MTKQVWEKPKLIVLGRGRPEEHVLAGCKQPGSTGGPGKLNCKNKTGPLDCSIISSS